MFDYIVAFYFGSRRTPATRDAISTDTYSLVKTHLSFLSESRPEGLNRVMLVVNQENPESGTLHCSEIAKLVEQTQLDDLEVLIVARDNNDFSYGAWQDALLIGMDNNPTYAFLCEDDYIPCTSTFARGFLDRFDDRTAYVCSLYRDNHAAISNGFISYEKCRDAYQRFGTIFALIGATNYTTAECNQINFLSILQRDYLVHDVTQQFNTHFLDWRNEIVIYGDAESETLIKPITN
jgi:hypothetical protein